MGHRFDDSPPANHVAAIIVGAPSLKESSPEESRLKESNLGGTEIGRNRFYGANDPRGGTGLALGY
jgi:gamma-glutamyltranspeptidase/glutathione hydrolase